MIRRLARNLTVQVLVAIACGALLGVLDPAAGKAMRPVGETFVNLVKMVITPVIFLTVVLGIARAEDLKRVGRVGLKALVYFEVVTTKYTSALRPTLPTRLRSSARAMPRTTVRKITGVITILTRLTKVSPTGRIALPAAGSSTPSSAPQAIATRT